MITQQLNSFTTRPVGAHAVLADMPDQRSVHQLTQWLLTTPLRGDAVEDVVPGACTVLIIARRDLADITILLDRYSEDEQHDSTTTRTVDIPVTYDGPDLDEVCGSLGVDRADFVASHCGAEHSVAFFGFTPGFAYIAGVPPRLHVPRRATPRLRIPAGSVAVANGYTVIYPGETPGGWNLVGHTTCAPLWDITHDPPNRLAVGDRIIFRDSG
jgi:KipI family sensor histidine kinase inhibitor